MSTYLESTCERCHARLRVESQHAGKQAKCPQCAQVYTVAHESTLLDSVIAEVRQPAMSEQNRPASPTADWKLQTPDGRSYGPVSKNELDRWVVEGRVNHACQVKKTSDQQWSSACNVYPMLTQPVVISKKQHQAVLAAEHVEPHRASLILALGILSFVVPIFFFGLLAWFMGANDLNKMKHGAMDSSGLSMTRAGRNLGIISVLVSVLVVFVLLTILMLLFIA